jgi:hypothetical protein
MTEPIHACLSCGAARLHDILSLGDVPVADRLLSREQLGDSVLSAPLEVVFCEACSLVQLKRLIPLSDLYASDYPYYTSVVSTLVEHFTASAERLTDSFGLGPLDTVVEIASNDGTMLKAFAERGVQVLGIDPAEGPAKAAEEAGVPTVREFFDHALAVRLRARGTRASVVLGNNVLNLVRDLDDFAAGVEALLSEEGVAVIEVPYVVDLIEKRAFDNIFHQNVHYFSLCALEPIFRRNGLYVNDVERIAPFGGSLRVTLGQDDSPSAAVLSLRAEEERLGVDGLDYYRSFAGRVLETRTALTALLHDLRRRGNSIAAFGAGGGMAMTLLSFLDVDDTIVDFAVDSNPAKQGRFMPGNEIPILPPSALLERRPDYVLLLAWNYADEIMKAHSAYREGGGTFIVPVPEIRLV